ncbi:MAG TPA: flagellar biosynthesis protein FlhB [Aquificaceae bacterium]|nr:flagellar biosynthesis protein FlhB [Aquificaceae bacterium]HIQ48274.1 flagellar biosynthesis protein FlhB [Aquifex aeolicus]
MSEEKTKKAIALRYNPEKDIAPIIVAKGKGDIARKIIELAKEHKIPVIEDETLVEALIRIDVYEEIPEELYEAVAKLLVYIVQKIL